MTKPTPKQLQDDLVPLGNDVCPKCKVRHPPSFDCTIPPILSLADRLFAEIKHGDDAHQAWLKTALINWFARNPLPSCDDNDRLTIALAFYSAPHNWLSGSVSIDKGERARVALAKVGTP